MSIINTMLQDLDRRNGRPGGEALSGDAVRSITPNSAWHVRRSIVVMLSGLVAVTSAGAWWMQHRAATHLVVVPAPPVPIIANNTPPASSRVAAASSEAATAVVESRAAVDAPAPPRAVQSARPHVPVAAGPKAAPAPKVMAMATAAMPSPAAMPSSAGALDTRTSLPGAAAVNSRWASAKTYSAAQISANLLGEAAMLDQQGHQEEAKAPLQRALLANPLDIEARRMLIRLQMDMGRAEEARVLLVEGQRLHPEQSDFTLALARLRVEAGDSSGAIQLLEAGKAAAHDEPQYHALLAALLLGAQRHDEAIQHYLVALRSDPANTRWLIGAGIALEAVGKQADAAEAYRRAETDPALAPETARFLSDRLTRLKVLAREAAANAVSGAHAARP